MATWASLTPEQQQIVRDNDAAMRPLVGELARLVNRAGALSAAWSELAGPIVSGVGGLDASELIPNQTQLAGSVDLQAYDTGVLMGYLSALVAGWDATHVNLAVKAAGALNTVGS